MLLALIITGVILSILGFVVSFVHELGHAFTIKKHKLKIKTIHVGQPFIKKMDISFKWKKFFGKAIIKIYLITPFGGSCSLNDNDIGKFLSLSKDKQIDIYAAGSWANLILAFLFGIVFLALNKNLEQYYQLIGIALLASFIICCLACKKIWSVYFFIVLSLVLISTGFWYLVLSPLDFIHTLIKTKKLLLNFSGVFLSGFILSFLNGILNCLPFVHKGNQDGKKISDLLFKDG